MKIVGLTGSIGMGKSTTADMFRTAGIPVNALYANEAVPLVDKAFPGAVVSGVVDRQILSRQLALNPDQFKTLEQIVHPLVRAKEVEFVANARKQGADIVVLDIPLLFETGDLSRIGKIIVVTCSPEMQRERVLARPNMTEDKFQMILSRQVPDVEKRAKADYIIDTGKGLDSARSQVEDIIKNLRA